MGTDLGASSSQLDLGAVDAASRSRRWTLAFPREIEQRFKSDMGPVGARRLAAGMPVVILAYLAFFIAEALLLPDVLVLALALRVLCVAPILVTLLLVLRAWPTAATRAWAATTILVSMNLQGQICFLSSASPGVVHYQYLVLMMLLLGNNILRPSFPRALVLTAVVILAHVAVILVHPQMTGPAIGTVLIMLVGAAYVTLVGNYQAERQTRRSYLRRLRDEIAAALLSRDNQALAHMARIDPLTQLENRRGLEAYVDELVEDATRRDLPFALLVMDVDHFKAFNDRHGHAEGDRCLKAIAEAARAELRVTDAFLGRLGGEEFIALLPGADLERGARIAERMRAAIQGLAIVHAASAMAVVTVSIGVAERRLSGPSAVAAAFETADAALYVAKWTGRNRVHAGPAPREPDGRTRSAA